MKTKHKILVGTILILGMFTTQTDGLGCGLAYNPPTKNTLPANISSIPRYTKNSVGTKSDNDMLCTQIWQLIFNSIRN